MIIFRNASHFASGFWNEYLCKSNVTSNSEQKIYNFKDVQCPFYSSIDRNCRNVDGYYLCKEGVSSKCALSITFWCVSCNGKALWLQTVRYMQHQTPVMAKSNWFELIRNIFC